AEIEGVKGDWPDRDPETPTGRLLNDWLIDSPPPNVWIGTTAEDQSRADERIPQLLGIPAKVRFLSCEPLLGPVNLKLPAFGGLDTEARPCGGREVVGNPTVVRYGEQIHWVIAGGES